MHTKYIFQPVLSFKSMSLKTQISLGFVVVLLLTLISLTTLFYYFNKTGNTVTTLLEQDYRTVKASEALVNSLMKMDRILAKVCLSDSYNETIDKLIRVISAYGKSTTFIVTIPNLKAKTETVEKAFL